MARIDFTNSPPALDIRGKFGQPNGFGEAVFGWSEYGDDNEFAGYYQLRRRPSGNYLVRMRPYWPTNTETEARRAWRNVFASGVSAWHSLTAETKQEYNKRKYPTGQSGFTRFMSEYLKEHAI